MIPTTVFPPHIQTVKTTSYKSVVKGGLQNKKMMLLTI